MPTAVVARRRSYLWSTLWEAARGPRKIACRSDTARSVLLLGAGAQRRPECSVEQASVLQRIDVGDVRGVAEIGLPAPHQVAVAPLADGRLRVDQHEMGIIPIPIERAPRELAHNGGTATQRNVFGVQSVGVAAISAVPLSSFSATPVT